MEIASLSFFIMFSTVSSTSPLNAYTEPVVVNSSQSCAVNQAKFVLTRCTIPERIWDREDSLSAILSFVVSPWDNIVVKTLFATPMNDQRGYYSIKKMVLNKSCYGLGAN